MSTGLQQLPAGLAALLLDGAANTKGATHAHTTVKNGQYSFMRVLIHVCLFLVSHVEASGRHLPALPKGSLRAVEGHISNLNRHAFATDKLKPKSTIVSSLLSHWQHNLLEPYAFINRHIYIDTCTFLDSDQYSLIYQLSKRDAH